jgi:hypothetical protein
MHEARQQATVEQRERGPLSAAIPQLAGRRADVLGQAFRADVEITHVTRRHERARHARNSARAHEIRDVHGDQHG